MRYFDFQCDNNTYNIFTLLHFPDSQAYAMNLCSVECGLASNGKKRQSFSPSILAYAFPSLVAATGNNHINGNRLLPQANRRTKIIFRSLHDDYAIHLFSSLDFFGLLYVYRTHYQWYA